MADNQIDNELELDESESSPVLDALSDIGDSIADLLREKISQNSLVSEKERTLAFSSVCQMLSLNAMVDLAQEIECDPLDIVDTWTNSFYEVLGGEEDGDEDEDVAEE